MAKLDKCVGTTITPETCGKAQSDRYAIKEMVKLDKPVFTTITPETCGKV